MAEHGVVNSVTSAVTGELTSRVFSVLVQRYSKDAATSEKLQRLEMLLIKTNSVVEASEKLTIENSSQLLWRDKLKEAASRGEEVLASFPQCAEDAQDTSNANGNHRQQQGEASSSSSATDVGPLSLAKNSLSSMVQGIRNARNMLFKSGVSDDMARLNTTLASLEQLWLDIGGFIKLLQLEARPKMHINLSGGHILRVLSPPNREDGDELPSPAALLSRVKGDNKGSLTTNFVLAPTRSVFVPKEQRHKLLQNRLEAAFDEISITLDLADSYDLDGLEWLAYWAGILREAKEQGRDVLGTIVNAKDNQEQMVEREQEDELIGFVHRLEGLARDVEYFQTLVHLCPAC